MKRNYAVLGVSALLCLSFLAGCVGKNEPPVPTPEDTAAPATPGTIVNVPNPEETPDVKEFVVSIEGTEEPVEMTRTTGVFPDGPAFALYVDKSRYTVNDVDGYCYLTDETGMVYTELGFCSGEDAETLSGTILNTYGRMQSTEDLGEVTLGELTARCVEGQTLDTVFTAYLIDTDEGCVTAVISMPNSTEYLEGARVRMTAMLNTLELS